jgi:hypothetical protein
LRPIQQLLELTSPGAQLHVRKFTFVDVDRARRVRSLVRIDPDDHRHGSPFDKMMWNRGGHS